LGIGGGALRVLSTIDLDGEAFLHAHEIDHILADWKLSSESEFIHLAHSQVSLKQSLGIGSSAS